MANKTHDLQYAVDKMCLIMKTVLENEPTARTVLLNAIEVVLASPHCLQQEPTSDGDNETSTSDSNFEYSQRGEDAAAPPSPVNTPTRRALLPLPPQSLFQDDNPPPAKRVKKAPQERRVNKTKKTKKMRKAEKTQTIG